MKRSPYVGSCGVTVALACLVLGFTNPLQAVPEEVAVLAGEIEFDLQVDLSFCPSGKGVPATLRIASECLDGIRQQLELGSPKSQGFAHAEPLRTDALSDPGVRVCLGSQVGQSVEDFSEKAVRECRRKVLEDRRSYLTSVLAAEARDLEKKIAVFASRASSEEDAIAGAGAESIEVRRASLSSHRGLGDTAKGARAFIAKVISMPDCKSLFVDHRCYDAWFANFSVGGEYNSVSEILGEKLFPRTGVLIYRNYSSYERWRRPHFFGEFRLAGAGESATTADVPDLIEGDGGSAISMSAPAEGEGDPVEPEPEIEIEKALDARGAIFFPALKIGDKVRHERRLQELIGPLVEIGIRKVDKTDEVDKRYYGGLRMSFNPEWFIDMLWGKTESVAGNRIEVRGQMPVYPTRAGNHVYIGAVANFRDSNAKNGESPEKDTVQVYLTWNVDFKSIFGK